MMRPSDMISKFVKGFFLRHAPAFLTRFENDRKKVDDASAARCQAEIVKRTAGADSLVEIGEDRSKAAQKFRLVFFEALTENETRDEETRDRAERVIARRKVSQGAIADRRARLDRGENGQTVH